MVSLWFILDVDGGEKISFVDSPWEGVIFRRGSVAHLVLHWSTSKLTRIASHYLPLYMSIRIVFLAYTYVQVLSPH